MTSRQQSEPQVAAGFEPVVDAFLDGIPEPDRSGAALSVWHDGREVVNIAAGTADARTGAPWTVDTESILFSASKGLAAITLWQLVATGRADLLVPIGEVWPEFGAHGKGSITIADVLAHRAGLSAPSEQLSLEAILGDRAWAEAIAAQEPLWAPGTAHAYHALTWGPIAQELVRRLTGRELHEVFAEEIAAPLEAAVTFRPTPAQAAAAAWLITTPEWDTYRTAGTDEDDAMSDRALSVGGALPRRLVDGDAGFNDPRVREAGLAAAGAIGTASGLARIWSAVITPTHGVRYLDDDLVAQLSAERSAGAWAFDPGPPYPRYGAGFQLSSELSPWFSARSVGHNGAGGQVSVADPDLGVALGYLRNRLDITPAVPQIIDAVRAVIDA